MVIHILHGGFPLCRFSASVPRDWPSGNSWVPIEAEADATCMSCIHAAKPKHAAAGANQKQNDTPEKT